MSQPAARLQLAREPAELTARLCAFAEMLPFELALDRGRLVIAHAGLPEELQGEHSEATRWFALYGCTPDEGFVRRDWARDYRGAATVVYGHTPTRAPTWIQRTLCIDTGCDFGGALTALRYPELELVSVPAARAYYATSGAHA